MVLGVRFISVLFLLLIISGSLLSTSFAAAAGGGGRSKFLFISELAAANADHAIHEEEEGTTPNKPLDEEELTIIHGRLLRANSRDYGHYDPSPALSKPPFKLIPN